MERHPLGVDCNLQRFDYWKLLAAEESRVSLYLSEEERRRRRKKRKERRRREREREKEENLDRIRRGKAAALNLPYPPHLHAPSLSITKLTKETSTL